MTAPDPTATLVFPVGDFHRNVIRAISAVAPPARHCAHNAIWHLNRAWKTKALDPEMALFRSGTAEEEAAAAVFKSLKRRHYVGAKRLNPLSHVHKVALAPFLDVFLRTLGERLDVSPIKDAQLFFGQRKKKEVLRVRFVIDLPEFRGQTAVPDQPLDFRFTVDGRPFDVQEELRSHATRLGFRTVTKQLRVRAAERHTLLYAVDTGVVRIAQTDIDATLRAYQTTTLRHLVVLLLIDPYFAQQGLAQVALDEFLTLLDGLPVGISPET